MTSWLLIGLAITAWSFMAIGPGPRRLAVLPLAAGIWIVLISGIATIVDLL